MNEKIVVVGGGVIGLSIAYELLNRGVNITLLESDKFAGRASWAGAGMLPPANRTTAVHPLEHLEAISNELHSRWAERLESGTGISTGYRKCGSLNIARTAGEIASLTGAMHEWEDRDIEFLRIDLKNASGFAPFKELVRKEKVKMAVFLPGAAQFFNPGHNQALVAANLKAGADLRENVGPLTLETQNGRIKSVRASDVQFDGDQFVFAAGAWTERLLNATGVTLPMQPVRGQIALYRVPPRRALLWGQAPIINEGSRYLVPRADGHVLAGATIEEAGFDCSTTDDEIADLRAWAEGVSDDLSPATYEKSWAGLRPGTFDGYPYLGRLPELENAIVATGHFKAGLQLSTGTAVIIADLAQGKQPEVDLTPFLPGRVLV